MTFLDCKKRFSYTFFSGGPGRLRAVVHQFIDSTGLTLHFTKEINDQARTVILDTLLEDKTNKKSYLDTR
jgi:1-acyl-sn-glycerol-3-phosphate acyltransferase